MQLARGDYEATPTWTEACQEHVLKAFSADLMFQLKQKEVILDIEDGNVAPLFFQYLCEALGRQNKEDRLGQASGVIVRYRGRNGEDRHFDFGELFKKGGLSTWKLAVYEYLSFYCNGGDAPAKDRRIIPCLMASVPIKTPFLPHEKTKLLTRGLLNLIALGRTLFYRSNRRVLGDPLIKTEEGEIAMLPIIMAINSWSGFVALADYMKPDFRKKYRAGEWSLPSLFYCILSQNAFVFSCVCKELSKRDVMEPALWHSQDGTTREVSMIEFCEEMYGKEAEGLPRSVRVSKLQASIRCYQS